MIYIPKIYILRWNPHISSINFEDWDFWVEKQNFLIPNWSIYEYQEVNYGDKWVMVRVGEGINGIVGHGTFCSLPQRGEDWNGKGKIRYYSDLEIKNLVSYNQPMILSDELEKHIPNINWRKGHSGELMSVEDAQKLSDLMNNNYYKNHPIGNKKEYTIEKGVEKNILGWGNYTNLFDKKEIEEDFIYLLDAFHDMVTLRTEHIYDGSIFKFDIYLRDNVLPIICKQIVFIKTKLYGNTQYGDYLQIWHDNQYFRVNINEVEVICKELEFGKTSKYEDEFVPVTI